jgi:hypothetical protein
MDGDYNRLRAVVRVATNQSFTPAAGLNQIRRMRSPYRKPGSGRQPVDPDAAFGFRFEVVIAKVFHASILLERTRTPERALQQIVAAYVKRHPNPQSLVSALTAQPKKP